MIHALIQREKYRITRNITKENNRLTLSQLSDSCGCCNILRHEAT